MLIDLRLNGVNTDEDAVKNQPLSLRERYALAEWSTRDGRRKRKDLPETIGLAIGMKVMATSNVVTNLDITNGARGSVVNIVLSPEVRPLEDACVV